MVTRPGWDEWALAVAKEISTRGDCTRRQVGAIIIEKDTHSIIGAGYNGHSRGGPSCLAGDCPRGRHYLMEDVEVFEGVRGDLCRCGVIWPCADAVPPGSSYDTGFGKCKAIHAEMNALLDVENKLRLKEATLYVTTEPCQGCTNILSGTTMSAIVWPEGRITLQ